MSAPLESYQKHQYLEMLNPHDDSPLEQVAHGAENVVHQIEKDKRVKYLQEKAIEVEKSFKKRIKRKHRQARLLIGLGLLFWFSALMVVSIAVMPTVVYSLFPEATEKIAENLGETADVPRSQFGDALYQEKVETKIPVYIPPINYNLPEENRLIISKIGIDTVIPDEPDVEKALVDGVWRDPELGNPEDRRLPILLAAHRFGYVYWTNEYRRENSFYNLPKLENGDRFEIIWNQRRYVYEIYEGYTDVDYQNFDGDVILLTCQVLNSDRRIFRHARLVIPEGFAEFTVLE